MKVFDGQKALMLRSNPIFAQFTLTLGTVSIAAGIVADLQMPAIIALIEMPALFRGAAGTNSVEHPNLVLVKKTTTDKGFPMFTKYLPNLILRLQDGYYCPFR